MSKPRLLILSHQGFSYAEDLIQTAKELGLDPVIISSQIQNESHRRINQLTQLGAKVLMCETPSLNLQDVRRLLGSEPIHFLNLRACISVWEGYRSLMASVNADLGCPDNLPESIEVVTDKYQMRKKLKDACLSRISTQIVSRQEELPKNKSLFIKPRRGLGSFGAFRLKDENLDRMIHELRQQMLADVDYAGVFDRSLEFVAEDEIKGQEFSFEIIANHGRYEFIATHQKLEVDETEGSTLESACTAPPISLDENCLRNGETLVANALKLFNLNLGCFHVEAKYDESTNQWEIIEINPRIGGAYIWQSTKVVSQQCLLRSWIQTLINNSTSKPNHQIIKSPSARSFFRVYFGTPGKQIEKIEFSIEGIQPKYSKIMGKPKTELSASFREIFIGQALWELPLSSTPEEVSRINQQSKNHLEVKYV